jgi:hypothetical protein
MNTDDIKSLLIPISTSLTLIATAVGVLISLRDFRLKANAETRLASISEIENEMKLLKLFSELMQIAHGRGGYHVSEKALEFFLENFVKPMAQDNTPSINRETLKDFCVVHIPVGQAQQDAAVASIGILGLKYEILREPAIKGLENIVKFYENPARQYLEKLKAIS